MATESERLRVVLDTNVIFAGLFSRNPRSPTAEILRRWTAGEFELLYCEDLRLEYLEKIADPRIDASRRQRFIARLARLGTRVPLSQEDVTPRVPDDPDDDVVLACALVGKATHLVTYDPHLLTLDDKYEELHILDGLHFLYALRGDEPPSEP